MAEESCIVVNLTEKRCTAFFQGLKLSSWQPEVLRIEEESPSDLCSEEHQPEALQNLTVSSKMACSICVCDFHSRVQQTEHYKLDWHRFNLKQSMMGAESVSEEHFESMTGDISSISGSDDSDDDVTSAAPPPLAQSNQVSPGGSQAVGNWDGLRKPSRRGSPKIFFENEKGQLLAIYRCLLQVKKESLLTQSELISRAAKLQDKQKWTILMVAGGHFAAAVFEGSEVISHKTFHRYTVRAKRGTAQGVRDGQQGGNHPRSAGASLRRYNEAHLREDVGNLLTSWQEYLDGSSHIFIRAPSHNRSLFFGGKNAMLKRDDVRIRTMPFPTRRPTFKEVKRVQNLLSSFDCYDNVTAAEELLRPRTVTKPLSGGASREGNIVEARSEGQDRSEHNGVPGSRLKGEPLENGNCDKNSDEGSVELFMEEVTSLTSHLKETEISVPKKPRRRRKKITKLREDDALKDKELKRLQAAIYTCCKTNDVDTFESLMTQLREKLSQDMKSNKSKAASLNHNTSNGSCDLETKDEDVSIATQSNGSSTSDRTLYVSVECAGTPETSVGSSEMTLASSNCEGAAVPLDVADLPQGASSNGTAPLIGDSECTISAESGDLSKEMQENIARFLNEKLDPNENRLLHVAAIGGHGALVWKLMANGADPTIKNAGGHHPITLANGKNTRLEFSRFMGEHPNKFDYKAARIPPPLTEEQEAAKAAKMKEKRRVQKKAKEIKRKEYKEEQKRKDQEEIERRKFLSLSDREKRALAAEKRLASQLGSTIRCFSCGAGLEGKVPFHYMDFKFCTMVCLKKHKQQQNT